MNIREEDFSSSLVARGETYKTEDESCVEEADKRAEPLCKHGLSHGVSWNDGCETAVVEWGGLLGHGLGSGLHGGDSVRGESGMQSASSSSSDQSTSSGACVGRMREVREISFNILRLIRISWLRERMSSMRLTADGAPRAKVTRVAKVANALHFPV